MRNLRIVTALLLALSALPATAAPEDVAPNAPDRYTVVKGDTLWGIANRFLKSPWRWPEVWRINNEKVRNPHLIYPGQVIVLDRNTGTLSMEGETNTVVEPDGTVRLQPRVYSTPVENVVTTLPMDMIRPFLSEPLVDDFGDSSSLPTVVGIEENRVLAGTNDTIFGKNLQAGVDSWQIYRRATPLRDPVTNQILAYEALFVADARTTSQISSGEATAMRVTAAKTDIGIGDRMRPLTKSTPFTAVPKAAPQGTSGRVIAIPGGVEGTGRYGIVALSVGAEQGVEPGQVVALYRYRGSITYRDDGLAETHRLPDNRYGIAFVFRTFSRVSYALVMNAELPVQVGDTVSAP